MFDRSIALLVFLTGCQQTSENRAVERIEIRESGWESLDVTLANTGQGSFERTGLAPSPVTGKFEIRPDAFNSLVKRLSEFRQQAVPRTETSIIEMGERRCPDGVPFATDNGAIYVRWVGKGFDEHFLADLGCDGDRMRDRNTRLFEIVQSLPIPSQKRDGS